MEIRLNSRDYKKLKKYKTEIPITVDEKADIPVIMLKFQDGHIGEYLKGYKKIKNMLKYGYNRIIKKCPHRHRKCIGEKCSLYVIENGTGDCSIVWQTMLLLRKG